MQTKLSKVLAAALIAASALCAGTVMAHGPLAPRHGGVVQSASDLSFEMVATADGAALYVVDHDNDYDAAKLSGKLTVLNGADRSEADLKPAGGNKLEARGVKLAKGAKVVAVLNTSNKKLITVRFTVR